MESFTIFRKTHSDDMLLCGEAYFLKVLLRLILFCLSTQAFADEAMV
jgi:hypothetical protein